MSEFKIDEVGFYKRRDGKKVKVVCLEGSNTEYPIICDLMSGLVAGYRANGRYSISEESPVDIVSKWVEPRKITLKRYLYITPHGKVYETLWTNSEPFGRSIVIDSKEVELPEGW